MTSDGCELKIVAFRIIFDDGVVVIDEEVDEEVEGQPEAVRGRKEYAARNFGRNGKAAKKTFKFSTNPEKN